jgi:hypothetical protein
MPSLERFANLLVDALNRCGDELHCSPPLDVFGDGRVFEICPMGIHDTVAICSHDSLVRSNGELYAVYAPEREEQYAEAIEAILIDLADMTCHLCTSAHRSHGAESVR